MKNCSMLKSFKNAFCGIVKALLSERNLRVHLMVAQLIMIFAYFFGITRIEWAVLILAVGFVFCAELINTAVEKAVDTATDQIRPVAGFSKDAAAGAVLASAITAVAVGFALFFNPEKIATTLTYIFTTPKALILCLAVGILNLLFTIFGGKLKR